MPRIHQLSAHEAQKIAAGEVVERPANVVKELIENALDAHATQITLYLEDAGKKLIRVVDNGHGMDYEDAKLCFGHHATSKITSVDDLQSLSTFGFRGEALSSIAAVSTVTLTTKEAALEQGIKLSLSEGAIKNETFVSCNPGTDIGVENIFYNVPARKKFLRTNETEWRQIVMLFQAFCLDYLTISFKLFHNNQLVHNCPATNDLVSRVAQVWDHRFSSALLPFSAEKDTITLSGAISHQHYVRYDRNQIFLFVNKRWIKNQHLSRALLKGYLNVLPPARYPASFLFITLPQHEIDINIHPRKEEAQFLHPRRVEMFIQEVVRKTLEESTTKKIISAKSSTKTFDFDKPAFEEDDFREKSFSHANSATSTGSPTPLPFAPAPNFHEKHIHEFLREPFPSVQQAPTPNTEQSGHRVFNNTSENNPQDLQQPLSLQTAHHFSDTDVLESPSEQYTLIGQLHKTYLLLEHPEGLFLIDQHAAHERILYEQFKQRFYAVASTQLLFPAIITLNSDDIAALTPYLSCIAEQGIGIELFGEKQVIIHATPIPIKDIALDELLHTLIGWIHENHALESAELAKLITEKLHAQMACKAAIKAGDSLSQSAMEELLNTLKKTANRFSCPHGRPTGWLIPTYDIEKKFKRKL